MAGSLDDRRWIRTTAKASSWLCPVAQTGFVLSSLSCIDHRHRTLSMSLFFYHRGAAIPTEVQIPQFIAYRKEWYGRRSVWS